MGLFNKFKKTNDCFSNVLFTCRHIVEGGNKATYISHKLNGDYECFCSQCEKKLDLNSVMVVGLEEILNKNNKEFFKLKEGNYIYLKDDNWYEKELEKNDEYTTWLFEIEDKIINENIRRNKKLRSDLSGIIINKKELENDYGII